MKVSLPSIDRAVQHVALVPIDMQFISSVKNYTSILANTGILPR